MILNTSNLLQAYYEENKDMPQNSRYSIETTTTNTTNGIK